MERWHQIVHPILIFQPAWGSTGEGDLAVYGGVNVGGIYDGGGGVLVVGGIGPGDAHCVSGVAHIYESSVQVTTCSGFLPSHLFISRYIYPFHMLVHQKAQQRMSRMFEKRHPLSILLSRV